MSALQHRVVFYGTLASLEEAGVPLLRALQQRFPGAFRPAAAELHGMLQQGLRLSEAMARLPRLFSGFETALVEVGDLSGRRDAVFKALRDWFQLAWRLRSKVISSLIYPALVYHVAAVLVPFIDVLVGSLQIHQALRQALGLMALPWVLWLLVRTLGGAILDLPALGRLWLAVPYLGGLSYRLDSSRFLTAFSLCLRAGMGSIRGVALAAGACRNPALRQRFGRLSEAMATAGCTFCDALEAAPLPQDGDIALLDILRTGEISGRLDEASERLARQCQEEAENRLARLAVVLPNLAYLGLLVYLGFRVISFYGKLMAPMMDLLE